MAFHRQMGIRLRLLLIRFYPLLFPEKKFPGFAHVLQSGTRTTHSITHGFDGFLLTYHATVQLFL
jgi:hypothetical protein